MKNAQIVDIQISEVEGKNSENIKFVLANVMKDLINMRQKSDYNIKIIVNSIKN